MAKPVLAYLRHVDPEIFMDQFSLLAINSIDDVYGSRFDAMLFGVGTDVSPALYGERPGSYTQSPDQHRDNFERDVFSVCRSNMKPMIGICRGAQLLTVMTGGKLVQHVTGHAGTRHDIITYDDRTININSIHHQMMIPRFGAGRHCNAMMLASTITPRSTRYLGQGDVDIAPHCPIVRKEPEIVVYGGGDFPNLLAIQGHPEWEPPGSDFWNYTQELAEKFIIKKEKVNHVVPA